MSMREMFHFFFFYLYLRSQNAHFHTLSVLFLSISPSFNFLNSYLPYCFLSKYKNMVALSPTLVFYFRRFLVFFYYLSVFFLKKSYTLTNFAELCMRQHVKCKKTSYLSSYRYLCISKKDQTTVLHFSANNLNEPFFLSG